MVIVTDTTDVRRVRVQEMANTDTSTVMIQCEFITGSDARGCLVVLMGGLFNTTVMLTKGESDRESVIIYMLSLPLTCYNDVFALDIESDESIGTLLVPGVIVMNFNPNSTMMCSPKIDETQSTLSKFMHDITIYTNFSTPHNYNWGKPERAPT